MANQTTPLGMGRTEAVRIDGYKLGRSRTSRTQGELSGVAWGSQIPLGRLAVYSPQFNIAVAAGENNPLRTVALPDATGDYVRDPMTGALLKDADASLLTNFKVGEVGSEQYLVAGVIVEGDSCDEGKCFQPQPWPVGNHDMLYRWNYAQHSRALTFMHHGYARVNIGEDLAVGDRLAFVDVPDNVDPSVGVQGLGFFVKAGNGVQDLPDTWYVLTGGKAGTSAEIYVGA